MRHWAGLWLPSLKPGQSDWRVLLSSLAKLYVRGVKIDWAGLHRVPLAPPVPTRVPLAQPVPPRRVLLPTYPFQRQRFWVAADAPAAAPKSAPPSWERLLENGDLERLAEELKALETFSDEEAQLLPRVLRALAKRQSRQSART
jgi:acyl transferase domain-containing protein